MTAPQQTQPPTPRRRIPIQPLVDAVVDGGRTIDDFVTGTFAVSQAEGCHRSVYTFPLRILDRVATAYETVFAGAGKRLAHFVGEHDYLQLAKDVGLTIGLGAAAYVGADILVDYIINAKAGGLSSAVKFTETALPPLAAFVAARGYLNHARKKAWHAVQSLQSRLQQLGEQYSKIVEKAERVQEQRPMHDMLALVLASQVSQQQPMLPAPQDSPSPVAHALAQQQRVQEQQDLQLEQHMTGLRATMADLQHALHHNIRIVERSDGLMRLPWAAFGYAYGNFMTHHVPLVPDVAKYALAGLYLLQREGRGAYTRAFVERGALWMVGAYAALPFVTGFAEMLLDKIPVVGKDIADFISGYVGQYRGEIATAFGLWRGYKSLDYHKHVVQAEHQAYAAARQAAQGKSSGGH